MQVTSDPLFSNGSITVMPDPTFLMIRPLPQAQDFMRDFTAGTGKAPATIFSPLIEITPIPLAQTPPPETQFLLFSSVNGVEYFAIQTTDRAIPALCVGDTTAERAAEHGFAVTSAGGSAADLLKLAQTKASKTAGPIYYISGRAAAHDLAQQLSDLGYFAQRLLVYDQIPQALTGEAKNILQATAIIPISSPNTAKLFAEQTQHIDLTNATCVCISPTTAVPLTNIGAKILIAPTPTRASMIETLDTAI